MSEQYYPVFPRFVLTFAHKKNKLQLGPLQPPSVTSYTKQLIVLRDVLYLYFLGPATHFSQTAYWMYQSIHYDLLYHFTASR